MAGVEATDYIEDTAITAKGTRDAKGNAKTQREQSRKERKEVNAKGAKDAKSSKKKFFLCFLCFLWCLCVLCGFPSIGVNLCQSVDDNAKTQREQKRRERKELTPRAQKGHKGRQDLRRVGARHRLAQRRKEKILCPL